MSEQNKQIIQQLYAAVNAHEPERLYDLIAEDVIEHEDFPGLEPGREGVVQFFKMMIAAFPDLRFEPRQIVAEGDTVMALVSIIGTHEGDFAGMPATGRRIDVPTVDIIRLADGKAAEHWGVTDSGMMMQQLGAIPEGAPAS